MHIRTTKNGQRKNYRVERWVMEWINVEAEKPKRNKNVLLNCILRKNGRPLICIGFWSIEPDEEPVFVLDDKFTELKGVTHWMPLPEPPKN
ncbi:DUF551 domain-containing protein [Acinetobacter baumannii]